MANPKKISLSQSRDIPFDKLVLSSRNVRRVRAGVSIEELAEDIVRRTLLQSLSVRAVIGEDGQPTDKYEVQAGGRRYRALELLVKQKRLAKNAPIPCIVRVDGILEEDSLAENCQRVSLHPLDQFRAFQSLKEQGLGEEEIAARFFVTPQIVRQRLKLASVSPRLLEVYADDEMSLEQLMSFTISDDHARQEQVWETVQRGYNKEPYYIRKLLTENTVRATDKRARFVGLAAYEEAGGIVLRDLFSQNDEGWLQDVALLEQLVTEKLAAEAEAIKAEGWKWIEVAPDFPYGHTAGLRRVMGEMEPLSDDEHSRREALRSEFEEIEQRYFQESDEDLPEEIDRRLAEIEAELDAFEERPVRYDPEEVARGGSFMSIDGDGRLKVERGYVRPEDEPAVEAEDNPDGEYVDPDADDAVADTSDAVTDQDEEDDDDSTKPLSDRLVCELTVHRTMALRDALANDPQLAMLACLHTMVLQLFYQYGQDSCIEISPRSTQFGSQAPNLGEAKYVQSLDLAIETWAGNLPKQPEDLWEVLTEWDSDSRDALFAHCVAMTVNAVQEPHHRKPRQIAHADILASTLGLDMVKAGWTPTADSYLGRVTKAQILAAVREAKGDKDADRIAGLKKPDMAEAAEELLAGTDWLPQPLRTVPLADDADEPEFEIVDDGDVASEEPAVEDDEEALALQAAE